MTQPTDPISSIGGKAAEWRRAFDQSFAEAALSETDGEEDFLAIGVSGTAYALSLAEVAALQALRATTPCPGQRPELLGLCSFRNAIVPVYDLRILMGQAASRAPAWWVLVKGTAVGLAFDAFEGHLRLPREARARRRGPESAGLYAREALRCGELLRPLISIASVLTDIKAIARQGAS